MGMNPEHPGSRPSEPGEPAPMVEPIALNARDLARWNKAHQVAA